ncbi:MAG: lysostaphin resistance A-like protein [Calditrichia bacterium]
MYIEAGRPGKHSALRYLLSFIAIILSVFIVARLIVIGIMFLHAVTRPEGEFGVGVNPENLGQLLYFMILFTPFIVLFATIFVVVKWIHVRDPRTLVTARSAVDWQRIFFAFGLWFALSMMMDVIAFFNNPESYVFQLDLWAFIPLMLIALVIISIQTSAEELFFRGYLFQIIGLLTKYRLIPILITSLLFGAMHASNPEVGAYGVVYMMTYYISVGLVLAVCTIMDDGLELALGYHAANNIYGALIVSPPDSAIETTSIFAMQSADKTWMMISWFFGAAVFLGVLWRKYNWGGVGKLFAKIDEPENNLAGNSEAAIDQPT